MNIWIAFSAFAYLLTVLSFLIVWRKAFRNNVSFLDVVRKWPFVDKALVGVWVIHLLSVLYTKNPVSFALNSVLLLYLVSKLNGDILKTRHK